MSAAVVRLPTAAPRKVRQQWNRQTRALHRELPRFPAHHHKTAKEREAIRQALIIKQVEPSAALVIALALFRMLDETEQLVAIGKCAEQSAHRPEVVQAIECLDAMRTGRTVGDNWLLNRAFDLIENGEAGQ